MKTNMSTLVIIISNHFSFVERQNSFYAHIWEYLATKCRVAYCNDFFFLINSLLIIKTGYNKECYCSHKRTSIGSSHPSKTMVNYVSLSPNQRNFKVRIITILQLVIIASTSEWSTVWLRIKFETPLQSNLKDNMRVA